jgi:hypothetical protein
MEGMQPAFHSPASRSPPWRDRRDNRNGHDHLAGRDYRFTSSCMNFSRFARDHLIVPVTYALTKKRCATGYARASMPAGPREDKGLFGPAVIVRGAGMPVLCILRAFVRVHAIFGIPPCLPRVELCRAGDFIHFLSVVPREVPGPDIFTAGTEMTGGHARSPCSGDSSSRTCSLDTLML